MLPSINQVVFDEKISYNGEALCTIDLRAIVIGESVVVMKNCNHIYHYECIVKRYENDNTLECMICGQEGNIFNRA